VFTNNIAFTSIRVPRTYAFYSGAGLLVFGMTNTTLLHSTFMNNRANGSGAGALLLSCGPESNVSNPCLFTVDGCVFTNNSVGRSMQTADPAAGGGLMIISGTAPRVLESHQSVITVTDTQFRNNEAYYSGAGMSIFIYQQGTTNITVEGCAFAYNYAASLGAGMHITTNGPTLYVAGLLVSNSTFEYNSVAGSTSGGGGSALSTVFATTCPFLNVTLDRIFVAHHAVPPADSVGIMYGTVSIQHGTGSLGQSIVTVSNSLFLNNSVANFANGAALQVNYGQSITFSTNVTFSIFNSTFESNTDLNSGGAVGWEIANMGDMYPRTANFEFHHVTLRNNVAGDYGGGLHVRLPAGRQTFVNLNMSHCSVLNNSATLGGGGVAFRFTALSARMRVNVSNNFFFNNSVLLKADHNSTREDDVLGYGGGLYMQISFLPSPDKTNGSLSVTDNVFENNTAVISGGGLRISSPLQRSVEEFA